MGDDGGRFVPAGGADDTREIGDGEVVVLGSLDGNFDGRTGDSSTALIVFKNGSLKFLELEREFVEVLEFLVVS